VTATEPVSYGLRLTQIAAERPDSVDLTIIARDGSEIPVTWQVLEARANQIARALADAGVGQGDLVALSLPTCTDHIFTTCAIWKLGATLLPLRHDMPHWEIERLLAVAAPVVLVSDSHHADCVLLTRASLAKTASLASDPLPDRISECVNLIASSGSTGTPKLIKWPSRGVVDEDPNFRALAAGMNEAPRTLVTSPLYHVNGFMFAAPRMLEGESVFVMEKFDAALCVELIERKAINNIVLVPTMLQRIARLNGVSPARLASLERVMCGGAKVPEWVVDHWLDLIEPRKFVFTYGSSEGLGFCTMTGGDWFGHRGSTGKPANCDLSIRDADGIELPHGTIGEIFLRPHASERIYEYIGLPTPPATADGFHTVGDLGWTDEDGYLYIADRRQDLIVTGGANVFPAEVETALSEHPDVIDQVVIGVRDDEWGHRVHALIQAADPEHPPRAEKLRAWCKARLAAYKVPKTYEFVETLPRTEAGKINRSRVANSRTRPS